MKTTNALLLFIIIASIVSCRHTATTNTTVTDSTATIADTPTTIAPPEATAHENYEYAYNDSVTDSLTVKGLPFTINGLRCYWNYTINLVARKKNPEYNARVIYQDLTLQGTDSILFKAITSPDDYSNYYCLADLEGYPSYNIDCKDINKDSWCDYEILFERAAAGANTTTTAYLFNPATRRFELSELFSGTNIEYDSAQNMIKTFWKMSVNDYVYTHTFLKPNKREVAYIEEEHHDGDSITYTKMVKGKVVSKRKVYEDDGQN